MKNRYFFISAVSALYLLGCTTSRYIISDKDVKGDKAIIVGMVEYDFSQLENKNIKGVSLFLDSQDKLKHINLPEDHLKNDRLIKQQFICSAADYGNINLCYKPGLSSTETNNLMTLMNAEKVPAASSKIELQEYSINGGKIINIGKLVVNYQGGKVVDGKINYSYTFQTNYGDTSALSVFKQTYPSWYASFSNEIFRFKNE